MRVCFFSDLNSFAPWVGLMKKQIDNEQGFTLIELVMVISLLGILAIAAMPIFHSLVADAEDSVEAATVGAIQSGIDIVYASNIADPALADVYPASLDSAVVGFCTAANPCFDAVLVYPITDSTWRKSGPINYIFERGSGAHTYFYEDWVGKFRD